MRMHLHCIASIEPQLKRNTKLEFDDRQTSTEDSRFEKRVADSADRAEERSRITTRGFLGGTRKRRRRSIVKRKREKREEGGGSRKRNELAKNWFPAEGTGVPGGAENINPRFVEIESRLIGARVGLTAREQIMSLGPTLY